MVFIGNLDTVHVMSVCIFYGAVVTDFKGGLDIVMGTACVHSTFPQFPTEIGS